VALVVNPKIIGNNNIIKIKVQFNKIRKKENEIIQ